MLHMLFSVQEFVKGGEFDQVLCGAVKQHDHECVINMVLTRLVHLCGIARSVKN